MSDPGHGSSAGAHEGHHHEAFDAEPATELSPGEPESPLWLPVVGLALFVAVGVWWSMGDEETSPETAPTAAAAVSAPAPVGKPEQPTRPSRRPAVAPPAAPPAAGAPPPGGVHTRKLDPEEVRRLRERLQQARAKGEQ